MRRSSRSSGFSLIELLVVVSILAVLTALSVVGLRGAFDTYASTAARNQVAAAMQAARALAMERQNTVAVVIVQDVGTVPSTSSSDGSRVVSYGTSYLYLAEESRGGFNNSGFWWFEPIDNRPAQPLPAGVAVRGTSNLYQKTLRSGPSGTEPSGSGRVAVAVVFKPDGSQRVVTSSSATLALDINSNGYAYAGGTSEEQADLEGVRVAPLLALLRVEDLEAAQQESTPPFDEAAYLGSAAASEKKVLVFINAYTGQPLREES